LIFLLNFEGVVEELALIERLADFGGNELLEFSVAEFLIAVKVDFGEARIALDDVGQDQALRRAIQRNANIVEQPGAIEIADILIDCGGEIAVALLDADIGVN